MQPVPGCASGSRELASGTRCCAHPVGETKGRGGPWSKAMSHRQPMIAQWCSTSLGRHRQRQAGRSWQGEICRHGHAGNRTHQLSRLVAKEFADDPTVEGEQIISSSAHGRSRGEGQVLSLGCCCQRGCRGFTGWSYGWCPAAPSSVWKARSRHNRELTCWSSGRCPGR